MHVGLAIILTFWLGAASAFEFNGPATRIIDGDTFRIGGLRIRICGIDAPETDMPGGSAATSALGAILQGQTARCIQVGSGTVCDGRSRPTNQGRIVAQCFVGDTDIADVLVEAGHACDWVRFSGGHYSRNGGATCP